MKHRLITAALAAGVLSLSGTALAQDAAKGEAAAKANGCLGCHTVDKKKVGPALKPLAAAYNKDGLKADAVGAKVKASGAHSDVKLSDDDWKNLGAWLLKL